MADLRIVDTPLLSTVKGTEKIPTGGEGNFSVSVNQVADFAKLKWFLATEGYVGNAVGDVQADLNLHKNNSSNPHQVTKVQVGLGNVDNTADLDKPVSNASIASLSLKADKSTTYTKTEVDSEFYGIYQNGASLPYDAVMEYVEGAVVVKDGKLQQWKGGVWKSVVATSLSDTIQTFNTPSAGVDPVTGVADGVYFNVRSSSDESYIDEYRNIGGVATATGKSYLSAVGIAQQEKAASTIRDSSGMSQQQINDLAKKWHPINVEKFRQAGFSDSQTIQAALNYINDLPYSGTHLIFETGRLYTYNAEHSIKNINNLIIDLNGATLKRAAGSTTSALLAQELTVAGSAGLTLTLDYIPDNWSVGEYLTVFTSDLDQDTSRTRRRITSINRTNNTVKIYAPLEFSPAKTTLPVGTRVAKNFNCFSGRPSSPDSGSYPLEAGINKRIFITNGTIDGNRANQYNVSWRFITEIGIHSIGGVIDRVHFKNITGETIAGHGISVQNCIYEDIGGSLYHTSLNDQSKSIAGFAWFTNNTVKRCNLETTTRIGHSEGAITFSWGAGNFIIKDNVLEDLTECFLGGFSTYTEAHGDEFLMVSGNIVKGAKGLIWGAQEPTRGIHITGNIFHDCGDSTTLTKSIAANPNNSIHGNTFTGNTKIYQQGTFDKLKAGVRRDTFGSIDNTVQYSAYSLIPDYLPPLDSGTVTATERNGTNFHAFVSTGVSGTIHYHPEGANAGSALATFNPSTKVYTLGTNLTDGQVHIKAGGYQDKMRFKQAGVDMPNFNGLTLGTDDADGSWRIAIISNNLVLQRRESGVWVVKQTFNATPATP